MKINDALTALATFHRAICKEMPEMSFEIEVIRRVGKWDGPFREWYTDHVPAKNQARESGIYLLTDLNETILYIGKAAANNLGSRIFAKFGTSVLKEKAQFDNSPMAEATHDAQIQTAFRAGDILVQAVRIRPSEFASLAEVYLQTLCWKREKELPKLNKRIG